MTARPVRIANCSGFYGDRLTAAAQLLDGSERIDVLSGDWLAELTMSILAKSRARGRPGYSTTFTTQMQQVLGRCQERGIKVVSNAGGIDPHGCAERVHQIAEQLGSAVTVAVVDGDDLTDRLDELRCAGEQFRHLDTGEVWAGDPGEVVAANAYLGGHGITAALRAGADVVITGRVADAAVVSGAAAWWHGWSADDLDALAGATVAGHAIECGTQVTGGNFAFFTEIEKFADLTEPGFPIAEIAADGSSVITKIVGTGGAITVDTVTAQLLYEIAGPRYPVPDVVTRFDTVRLRQLRPDRVEICAATGEPAPAQAKALLTYPGGFRNSMTLAITGAGRRAKAELAERAVWAQIPGGRARFAESLVEVTGARLDSDAPDDQSYLRISVADPNLATVGREFSSAVVATALASYPGLYLTSPPGPATEFMVGWPTLIDASHLQPRVHLRDKQIDVAKPSHTQYLAVDQPRTGAPAPDPDGAEATIIDVGHYVGARSGDKGGNANLGLWVRDERHLPLLDYLSVPQRLAALLPELRGHDIRVYPLPNLRAVNVIIAGLLGNGAAASLREDPQAKSLGERFRAVRTAVPAALLPELISTEA
jgi:hypothetical protein